jgi:RND family efflux transporter MFP subunit
MTSILRRSTFWLALAGLAALVLFVRANTATSPMQSPPSSPPDKPFPTGIGASGIVEALRENTSLGVPFSSLVSEVRVKVWQQVKRGDVLLVLDDRDRRIQLKTLHAELTVREAEIRRSQRRYDRYMKIGSNGAIAKQDLESSEDELNLAKAHLEKAKAAISETEEYLDRYLIRAPIDGTILQVNIRAGEHASPGASTAPVVIGHITEMQIRADVDEQLAPRVREGAKAVAYRKGESGKPIPLTFLRIEPFIVPKKSLTGSSNERVDTRVLPVIFSFANEPKNKTYVGQQVDVFIEE